jgi:DNA-binding LacI/PurR family transcriptional regulator
MAATAARQLIAMSDGREPISHRIALATSLVVRESTAPLRVPVRTPRANRR